MLRYRPQIRPSNLRTLQRHSLQCLALFLPAWLLLFTTTTAWAENGTGLITKPTPRTHASAENDTDAAAETTTEPTPRTYASAENENLPATEPEPLSSEELETLLQAFESGEMEPAEDSPQRAFETDAPTRNNRVGAAILQTLNPEMALVLDLALAYFSDTPQQLGAHDPQRTGFTFQQLELSFTSTVDPYFRFQANLVFGEFGVEIEEAFAQTTSLPGRMQIRAGQFLQRFGRINDQHPHSWSFLDLPLAHGRFFGPEGQRGLGAEVSWLAPTPWYLELIGSVTQGSFTGHSHGEEAEQDHADDEHDHPASASKHRPRDFIYLLALKNHVAFDASWSLAFGVSALLQPIAPEGEPRTQIYGADVYLRYLPVQSTRGAAFSLHLEYLHRRQHEHDDHHVENGLLSQAIWTISRRWETGVRYEWVHGSAHDLLDPAWSSARHRASLQGTFYPSHFSRLRVQGNYDNPTWQPQPIWSAMLGVEFVIGAHGSHRF